MQSFKFHFICPFHDFSAQLPYLCPLPPLFTLPRPPTSHFPSLSANYRTKQNYFDLYARRESSMPTLLPWHSISLSTCPSSLLLLHLFRFYLLLSTVNRFGNAKGDGDGVRPTKCFDSAWTRLQLLSTKRVDERRI